MIILKNSNKKQLNMRGWDALQAIRWLLVGFWSTEVVVHIFLGFWFPRSAAIFVCSNESRCWPVLLCASVSFSHLTTTFQHREEKKKTYAVHGLHLKMLKTIKKRMIFFHCQILNGALYLDWVDIL